MKNNLAEGDVIIHSFVNNDRNQFQWMYCVEGGDKTKNDFKSGCNKKITSVDAGRGTFDTREEAIADVNKYAEKNDIKKPNIIG